MKYPRTRIVLTFVIYIPEQFTVVQTLDMNLLQCLASILLQLRPKSSLSEGLLEPPKHLDNQFFCCLNMLYCDGSVLVTHC